jgi:hypothetical protein
MNKTNQCNNGSIPSVISSIGELRGISAIFGFDKSNKKFMKEKIQIGDTLPYDFIIRYVKDIDSDFADIVDNLCGYTWKAADSVCLSKTGEYEELYKNLKQKSLLLEIKGSLGYDMECSDLPGMFQLPHLPWEMIRVK